MTGKQKSMTDFFAPASKKTKTELTSQQQDQPSNVPAPPSAARNGDDGLPDAEEVPPTAPRVMMAMSANRAARDLVKPFAEKALEIVQKHNFFEHPCGLFSKMLLPKKVTVYMGNYVIYSADDLTKIEKAGSTSNFTKRVERYSEQGVDPSRFRIVVDLDGTHEEFHREFGDEVYHPFVKAILESPDIPAVQKHLFDAIYNRGGDKIGYKKQIWLQMVEIGLQQFFGLPCPAEFLMCDDEFVEELYESSHGHALHLVKSLALSGPCKEVFGIASWMPAHDQISTKQANEKLLTGREAMDTLPLPAKPNAKTTDDIFSTDYTDSQKEWGRKRLISELQRLIALSQVWVLFCDTNKLILDNDRNCRHSIHDILTEQFEFVEQQSILDDQIVAYTNATRTQAVVVHGPLCKAGDSRVAIPFLSKAARGFETSVLACIGNLLRGVDRPVKFNDPVAAMAAFQISWKGFHQRRPAAAVYKDFVTGEETHALVENRLSKHSHDDVPISKQVRKKRARDEECIVDRPLDTLVQKQARAIISQVMPCPDDDDLTSYFEEKGEHLFRAINELFSKDGGDASSRWKYLLNNHIEKESLLEEILVSTRNRLKANSGNCANGAKKSKTKVEKASIDSQVQDFITKHHPPSWEIGSEGAPFWIAERQDSIFPPDGTLSECGDHTYPGEYTVFDALTIEGLRIRFKPDRTKGNTNALQSKKHPHLTANRVGTKRNTRHGVKVFDLNATETQGLSLMRLKIKK